MAPSAEPPAIREATAGDRPAIDAMFAALQTVEREVEPNRAPPEACGPHVDHLLDWAARGGCVLIAEDAEGPAGLLIAGLRDEGAYVLPENRIVAEVSDLWVAPRARRRGLALALLAEAERRFAAAGRRRMEISTLAANPAAAALYHRWSGGGPHLLLFAREIGRAAEKDPDSAG